MSSKRAKRRKACDGKQRHPDPFTANNHLFSLMMNGEKGLSIYHCHFCKGWHVGHRSTDPKTKRLQKKG